MYAENLRPAIDSIRTANAVSNGWCNIWIDYRQMWFFKQNGEYKSGWHWDDYYNGWYYFYDIAFKWYQGGGNAAVMYDPHYDKTPWLKLNNKWYEFENGGKLKTNSGWRKYYNGKWLYHIQGDYGAVADQGLYIDGTYYEFDSNGYWKEK